MVEIFSSQVLIFKNGSNSKSLSLGFVLWFIILYLCIWLRDIMCDCFIHRHSEHISDDKEDIELNVLYSNR